jgi:phosphoglycerate kinase
VNDALGASHRAHASVVGLPRHVSERAQGLVLEQERRQLTRLLASDLPRPFVVVLGGSSATLRLPLIEVLLDRADALLVGGAVGNTFLKARGDVIGRSLHDGERLPLTRSILKKAQQRDIEILVPTDLLAAAGTRSTSGRVIQTGPFPDDLAALDIGPETAKLYAKRIALAQTVFWNGPMGAAESEPFAGGTHAIARAMAEAVAAFTVASGDDTVATIRHLGLAKQFGHLSGGGEATLEFLEGKKLPGMAALEV